MDRTDTRAQSCDYFLSHSSPRIPTREPPSSRMNDRRGDVNTRSSISWRHVGGDSGARRSCYDRATVMWPIGTRHNRHRQRNVRCMHLWTRIRRIALRIVVLLVVVNGVRVHLSLGSTAISQKSIVSRHIFVEFFSACFANFDTFDIHETHPRARLGATAITNRMERCVKLNTMCEIKKKFESRLR